jgi:hypothetical protein
MYNFPVPVLAEPDGAERAAGEARESTTFDRPSVTKADSRGGENFLGEAGTNGGFCICFHRPNF